MKINEIRVGNWFNSIKWNKPVYCELVDLYELCAMSDGAYNDPPIDCMFEPLPLTEEWLLKFGFEYCQFTIPDEDGVLRDKKESNKDYFKHPKLSEKISYYLPYHHLNYYIGSVEIRYVHQLQNFCFAICGKELEIK